MLKLNIFSYSSLFLAIIGLLTSHDLKAQVLTNNDVLFISAGAEVKVNNGAVLNQNSAQIINNGNLYIGGSYYEQNTAATYVGSTTGWLWFDGSSDQNLLSDATLSISRLKVDNGNRLILNQQTNLSNALDLSNNGALQLGTHQLQLAAAATISGYDENNYVITNATGTMQRAVDATPVVFPVGNSSYNPAILINNGTTDNFQIRVLDDAFEQGTIGTIQTENIVDRSWIISESVLGGSNLDLELEWNEAEELAFFDRGNSAINRHISGLTWDNPVLFTPAMNVGTNRWSQFRSGITALTTFVVEDNLSSLPVELLEFTAERLNFEEVDLNWVTATELNNEGFYIERMIDGEAEFSTLAFVEGSGNSTDTRYYHHIDLNNLSLIHV